MVQGFRNHIVDFRLSSHSAEVETTYTENGNLQPSLPHGALRRLKLRHRSSTLTGRVGHDGISLRRVALPLGGGRGDHGNSTCHSETFQEGSAAFPAFSIGLQS
jgi:hypothetical protein